MWTILHNSCTSSFFNAFYSFTIFVADFINRILLGSFTFNVFYHKLRHTLIEFHGNSETRRKMHTHKPKVSGLHFIHFNTFLCEWFRWIELFHSTFSGCTHTFYFVQWFAYDSKWSILRLLSCLFSNGNVLNSWLLATHFCKQRFRSAVSFGYGFGDIYISIFVKYHQQTLIPRIFNG